MKAEGPKFGGKLGALSTFSFLMTRSRSEVKSYEKSWFWLLFFTFKAFQSLTSESYRKIPPILNVGLFETNPKSYNLSYFSLNWKSFLNKNSFFKPYFGPQNFLNLRNLWSNIEKNPNFPHKTFFYLKMSNLFPYKFYLTSIFPIIASSFLWNYFFINNSLTTRGAVVWISWYSSIFI